MAMTTAAHLLDLILYALIALAAYAAMAVGLADGRDRLCYGSLALCGLLFLRAVLGLLS